MDKATQGQKDYLRTISYKNYKSQLKALNTYNIFYLLVYKEVYWKFRSDEGIAPHLFNILILIDFFNRIDVYFITPKMLRPFNVYVTALVSSLKDLSDMGLIVITQNGKGIKNRHIALTDKARKLFRDINTIFIDKLDELNDNYDIYNNL